MLRKIRHPSQPDQFCSGKSGKPFQTGQSCAGKSGKLPSLINPAQTIQAIQQKKEIFEESYLNCWHCFAAKYGYVRESLNDGNGN